MLDEAILARRPLPPLSEEQWDRLPAGYFRLPNSTEADAAHFATLKQTVEQPSATLTHNQVSRLLEALLAHERVKEQDECELAFLDAGLVGKRRALDEVEAEIEWLRKEGDDFTPLKKFLAWLRAAFGGGETGRSTIGHELIRHEKSVMDLARAIALQPKE